MNRRRKEIRKKYVQALVGAGALAAIVFAGKYAGDWMNQQDISLQDLRQEATSYFTDSTGTLMLEQDKGEERLCYWSDDGTRYLMTKQLMEGHLSDYPLNTSERIVFNNVNFGKIKSDKSIDDVINSPNKPFEVVGTLTKGVTRLDSGEYWNPEKLNKNDNICRF